MDEQKSAIMLWEKELKNGKLVHVAIFEGCNELTTTDKSRTGINYALKSTKDTKLTMATSLESQEMNENGGNLSTEKSSAA